MKNEQPTLVILIPGFPKDEEDSTCLPAQQRFIRSVNEHFPFIRVVILSLQYPFAQREYAWHDNTVIAFGGRNRGGLSRLLLWRRVDRTLRRIKKQRNVIGLLSFWCGECGRLGNMFGKKYGLLHYCWIMGQDAKKENTYVKRLHPDGEDLIAISDFIQEEFGRNHQVTPAHVIPIGIDPSAFTGDDVSRHIDILCAGSLIPLKQYELAIDTIAAVAMAYPSTRAVICGKGPAQGKLVSMVKDAGLQDTIVFAGEIPHRGLLQLMRQSRVFLHPSSFEGFSGVCLEALYAGAQVISFCQAMNQPIGHWHLVDSLAGMKETAITLLGSPSSSTPVLPYPMRQTGNDILKLFGW